MQQRKYLLIKRIYPCIKFPFQPTQNMSFIFVLQKSCNTDGGGGGELESWLDGSSTASRHKHDSVSDVEFNSVE